MRVVEEVLVETKAFGNRNAERAVRVVVNCNNPTLEKETASVKEIKRVPERQGALQLP
jgi:hypothetical protein